MNILIPSSFGWCGKYAMIGVITTITLQSHYYILLYGVHHVQKYTRAILPHAALCHSTKVHSITNNQVW